MTSRIYHTFVSPKSDGADATLVQPSNWNADHYFVIDLTAADVTTSISGTSGLSTITVGSASGLYNGMYVTGTGIGTGAYITNIASLTVTLSVANAGTVSGTGTFTSLRGPAPLAKGGTNNAITAVNGGLVYSDASKLNVSAAIGNSKIVMTDGSGLPIGSTTLPAGTTSTYATAITAAGTTTTDATALTADANFVTTVASGTGVRLPADATNRVVTVFNSGANPLKVYPPNSSAIDSLGTNVGFTIPVGYWCSFVNAAALTWRSGANSVVNGSAITGAVPVANGGTGATSTTGSAGSVVLSAGPTFTGSVTMPTLQGTAATGGAIAIAGGTDNTGTVNLNAATINSSNGTVALLSTPTTITIGAATSSVNIGSTTGTLKIAGAAGVLQINATTVLSASAVLGAATAITVGGASPTVTIGTSGNGIVNALGTGSYQVGGTTVLDGSGNVVASAATVTLGGTSTTTYNIGSSTAAPTINIGYGATTGTNTKTVNIGTGSTTVGTTNNVVIGSSTLGVLGTTTINTPTVAANAVTTFGAISQAIGTPSGLTNGGVTSTGGSLPQSTTYFFKVAAEDIAGNVSLATTELSVAITATGTATNQIALTWTGVQGAVKYRVYYSTTTNTQVNYMLTTNNSTSYAFTTTTGNVAGAPFGNTATANSNSTGSVGLVNGHLTSLTMTQSSATSYAFDYWETARVRSAKYMIQITQGANFEVLELLVIHDGTNTWFTEYGRTGGTTTASFSTTLTGGMVTLSLTLGTAVSTTVKAIRQALLV